MKPLALMLGLLAGFFLLRSPRCWAALPLLIGASYAPDESALELGPFHFPVIRILIGIGIIRVMLRREHIVGGVNILDKMMILWAAWAVCSSCFHEDVSAALTYRLGLAYNALGLYFLLRVFVQNTEDVFGICRIVILASVPIAFEMLNEALTGRNLFFYFGGAYEFSDIRGGKIRAQGPFAHSILAGTVGAVCLPLAIAYWRKNRNLALVGTIAAASMVASSRSSGPIMTCIFALFGLGLWWHRDKMRVVRWTAVVGVLSMAVVMQAPIYYLLARIDLTGSSTGYHRAILIEAAIRYFDEWWLGGTDYTLHWTPNPGFGNDTDITNHYIRMGIWGGLPLMCLFIGILVVAFVSVSKALKQSDGSSLEEQFLIWTLGCILFAHTGSMMSVSYFDHSILFLYLVLAAIGSLRRDGVVRSGPALSSQFDHEGNIRYHS